MWRYISILLILFAFQPFTVSSQSLNKQLNAGSNVHLQNGVVYTYSLGKAFTVGNFTQNSASLVASNQAIYGNTFEEKEKLEKLEIRIFPNPATDYIRILCGMRQYDITLVIMNLQGQVMHTETIFANTSNIMITLPNQIENGNYLVHLTSAQADIQQTIKLIVTR